jgi:hypothetical protein
LIGKCKLQRGFAGYLYPSAVVLERACTALQVDEEIAETIQGSNCNKCSTHVDARLLDTEIPVALDGLALEKRQEEAGNGVQHYEGAQSPAKDLV